MIFKQGSKGEDVKKIQQALGLKADGIFGVKTTEAVKKFQREHKLTADGIVGQTTWNALFKTNMQTNTNTQTNGQTSSINITKGYINTHITKSPNRSIKYIAVHYTAGGSSKSGSAMNIRNVFLKRKASADFVVDDTTIVQINPDIKNYYCWAVGDKKNPYSKGGQLYGKATNKNTISIEMCSTLQKGWDAAAANHEGWYVTDAVVDNTVKLVQYLMKKYNVPESNVVRHYDISGKLCPGIVGWNNEPIYDNNGKKTDKTSTDIKWQQFKSKIK